MCCTQRDNARLRTEVARLVAQVEDLKACNDNALAQLNKLQSSTLAMENRALTVSKAQILEERNAALRQLDRIASLAKGWMDGTP